MDVRILPQSVNLQGITTKFEARHPMFRYQVSAPPAEVREKMAKAQTLVVVGLGGSCLPLKAFVDFFKLSGSILFLDTVDGDRWARIKKSPAPLFCIVSKSGETLEIKALLAEVLTAGFKDQLLMVTDPEKGLLRSIAREMKAPSLEIPSDLGGRFTNYSIFHRAALERFGVDFDSLLKTSIEVRDRLLKDPLLLEGLFQQVFLGDRQNLILWAYGDRLKGLAEWMQQAIAESLGKRTKDGKTRVGLLPTVLEGPQDQHTVLQFLVDAPQKNTLWFLRSTEKTILPTRASRDLPPGLQEFKSLDLDDALEILAEATFKTFEERLQNPETLQPLSDFQMGMEAEEIAKVVAIVQAFIEYAGDRLGINAFDQPGVERGKQISRELLKQRQLSN